MSVPDFSVQLAALVQQAYDAGSADGLAAAAAPVLALEAELSSDLAKVQAELQALLNPVPASAAV